VVLLFILLGEYLTRYKIDGYVRRVVRPVDDDLSLLTLIILYYDLYRSYIVGVAILACARCKYYGVYKRREFGKLL